MNSVTEQQTFTLDNFEGPLDLLYYLIQKQEIDIYDICIHQLTEQYLRTIHALQEKNVDVGAEFIHMAASLILLKSKTLLPPNQQVLEIEEEGTDPRFEIIHQLLDYCRFKEAAKDLAYLEEQQSSFFPRGLDAVPTPQRKLGIEHLSLDDFALLFEQMLAKIVIQEGSIDEEEWRVSDKIRHVRKLLKESDSLLFEGLFSPIMSRGELIVTFLAVLELMKLGEAKVARLANRGIVVIAVKETGS